MSETRFWDRIAVKYAARPISDMESYQRKLDETRACLTPDSEVLEIGCGSGTTAIAHAPFVGHIRATDISKRMLEIAADRARQAGVENVAFEQVEVGALTADDGRYDCVMAHSLLHLLPDMDAAIAEAYRWLRPGGVFVSSTICLGDMSALFRLVIPGMRWVGLAPFVRFVREDALVGSLERAGFAIETRWRPSRNKAVFVIARKPG
ncbi:MAG: methyltransferase domain-containing protein [Alphaproteobacteria bacterium]|nr:methyltransferase domain-containing protein [Alphaproteobacteria bacterium]